MFVAVGVKASEVDKIFGVNDRKDDAAAASVLLLSILEASDCTGVDADTQASVVHTFLLIGVAAETVVAMVDDAELNTVAGLLLMSVVDEVADSTYAIHCKSIIIFK